MVDVAIVAIQIALTSANLRSLSVSRAIAALAQITTHLPTIMFDGCPVVVDVTIIVVNVPTVAVAVTPSILGHCASHSKNTHQKSTNQCTFHSSSPSRAAFAAPFGSKNTRRRWSRSRSVKKSKMQRLKQKTLRLL